MTTTCLSKPKPAVDKELYCRHCGKGPLQTLRPRKLCDKCHKTPEIRDLYPVHPKWASHKVRNEDEVLDFNGGYRLPGEPTAALPGTPEKVAVLEERARLGVCLWHPDDADFSGPTKYKMVGGRWLV